MNCCSKIHSDICYDSNFQGYFLFEIFCKLDFLHGSAENTKFQFPFMWKARR